MVQRIVVLPDSDGTFRVQVGHGVESAKDLKEVEAKVLAALHEDDPVEEEEVEEETDAHGTKKVVRKKKGKK